MLLNKKEVDLVLLYCFTNSVYELTQLAYLRITVMLRESREHLSVPGSKTAGAWVFYRSRSSAAMVSRSLGRGHVFIPSDIPPSSLPGKTCVEMGI